MNISEINQRIEKVMKTDATFAREADFMITHVPFVKLYDFVPESGQTNFEGGKAHYYINPVDYYDKKSFDENELLNSFMEFPNSHKFLLVQGNSGTGKSNLIRWIYYMYQKRLKEDGDEKEQIIFIQRSYNSLKDAVKRILDYKILPADRTRYYLDKIGGGGQEATGEELAATAYAMLNVAVDFDTEYDQYIDEDLYNGIKVLLNDNNVKKYIFMKSGGPIDRICKRITGNRIGISNVENDVNIDSSDIFVEKDFSLQYQEVLKILSSDGHKASKEVAACCSAILQNPENRYSVVAYLNSKNEKVIARSSTLDATDVKSIFKEIRKELKNEKKNLTLFIEDINAYTGMDKALIDILIDDEEDDDSKKEMCRLKSMVGSTDNFYDLLHTSLKARITNSIVVLDESVLSDESKLLEFAARYINAVNLSADQVDDWYYNNHEFPVADIINEVTSVEINGTKFSIHPFTKEAILNLYSCLDVNYKTPRGLLKYVIKNTLMNWNTMEDRIFETSTSFINIGIRSFSALKLPNAVRQSTIEMSEKEKQYIQIWGYNYQQNKIVNNSENEKKLFRINVADVIEPAPDVHKPNPISKTIDQSVSKKDKVLNHIEEWEKKIVSAFLYHKDMRDWIGKYILGHINWQQEGILYSKAAGVCKTLSFIKIEGQESSGNSMLLLERNSENADFFRAIVYWNYDGDKKSWLFPGGMEEKIIAKVWLEKHKDVILSAVREFGKLDQVEPEYIVRAKIYSLISHGSITSLDEKDIIEALFRSSEKDNGVQYKNKNWKTMSEAITKHDAQVDELFKEYYCRSIGSSDAISSAYTFVDLACLKSILYNVISEIDSGRDKKVLKFNDKQLEAPIETINIFQQFKENAVSISENIIRQCTTVFENAFGKNASNIVIEKMVYKMQEYLNYINRGLNQATPPNIINTLENKDTPKKLASTVKQIVKYNEEKSRGKQLIILSLMNDELLQNARREIEDFIKLMKDIEAKYTSKLDKNVTKDIESRKKSIKKLVDSLIATGGVD